MGNTNSKEFLNFDCRKGSNWPIFYMGVFYYRSQFRSEIPYFFSMSALVLGPQLKLFNILILKGEPFGGHSPKKIFFDMTYIRVKSCEESIARTSEA